MAHVDPPGGRAGGGTRESVGADRCLAPPPAAVGGLGTQSHHVGLAGLGGRGVRRFHRSVPRADPRLYGHRLPGRGPPDASGRRAPCLTKYPERTAAIVRKGTRVPATVVVGTQWGDEGKG